MFTRGRIGEGWLGEMYAGEDVQGRPTRFISLVDWSDAQRSWLIERMRLMNLYAVQGACPQLGLQIIQGEPCWVGAWRDAVQLSVLLDEKHLPNTVIMSIAYGIIQSLHSAQKKGVVHGYLHPNGIWIGVDGQIWIDGYGQSIDATDSVTDDVFVLGQLLVEMFLGECPFPVPDERHLQTLQEVGLELKALGLPRKLPRQIMRLLHPDPKSRPTMDMLSDKWKITRGASILSGWVRSQFPQIVEASRPEDRIPTAKRIAPLPCPIVETVLKPLVDEEQTTVEPDILSDDDTLLRSIPETLGNEPFSLDNDQVHEENAEDISAEDTLLLPEGQMIEEATEQVDFHHENTDEVAEETQVIAFVESVELEFFDDDPTSRLMVEEAFFSSDAEPVESLDLAEEMDAPSRRPLMGLLWICVVGMLTVLGLYWTLPNIAVYPEEPVEVSKQMDEEISPVVVEAIPALNEPETDTVIPSVEPSSTEEEVDEPEVVVVPQRSKSTVKSKPSVTQPPTQSVTVNKNPKVDTTPVSTEIKPVKPTISSVAEKPPVKEESSKTAVVENTEDLATEPVTEPTTEPTEPIAEVPSEPKVTTGTVKVNGDHASIRFEREGRDIPMGTMETGAYTVYVTFEGFNEFKVTTFTVDEGKVYTVNCNSMFATCQVK